MSWIALVAIIIGSLIVGGGVTMLVAAYLFAKDFRW